MALSSAASSASTYSTTVSDLRSAPTGKPLHDGAEICSFMTGPDPDATVNVKLDSQFLIGFGEPVPATITDLGLLIEAVREIIRQLAPG